MSMLVLPLARVFDQRGRFQLTASCVDGVAIRVIRGSPKPSACHSQEAEVVAVFQRKSRLVSFRLSKEEYESLRQTAVNHRVGISDIARFAVRKVLAIPSERPDRFINYNSSTEESIAKLTQNLEQLTHRMDEILQRLDLLNESPKNRRR